MNNCKERGDKNLSTPNKKSENRILAIVFSAIIGIAIVVCTICDFAISRTLSWSLVVLSSCFIAWSIIFPILLLKLRGIKLSIIAFTLLIIPYLFVLSILTSEKQVLRVGLVMAIIFMFFIWGVYILFIRLPKRKLFAAGISCIMAVLFIFIINFSLSKLIGSVMLDIRNVIPAISLLVIGGMCIMIDFVKKK